MLGTSRVVATLAVLFACACGTGDTKVDPGDLELRDLLGVAPEVATTWDAEQRAAARRVLVANLDAGESEPIQVELAAAKAPDDRIARTLASLDMERFAAGDAALGFVRVELTASELTARLTAAPTVVAATGGTAPQPTLDGTAPQPTVSLELSDRWGTLPARSQDLLAALAIDAGHRDGRLVVTPVPRLAVIASYAPGNPARLTVNPVLVAALDPSATEALVLTTPRAAGTTTEPERANVAPSSPVAAGNPYSFYGSIAECAYAQRLRCESCLGSTSCMPVTSTSDGNAECTTLGASDGRGYFLLCINQALAITSVNDCAADAVSGCARNTRAANDLALLDANANFLDDTTCSSGLDSCLARIYGEPQNPFPGLVDGGVTPPPDPPRDTDVSCGESCDDDKSSNCEASPSCNCEGPSCNNSFSCDSTCASSNDQSGCGSCESCESDGGGGGGGGCSSDSSSSSGGGCGGDSSSGGGSCGSCDSSSGGGGGGGGGGGCSSSDGGGGGCSGGGGGGCSGGGDGGSCGGGGGGGDCGGGGGGSSSCNATKKAPSAGFAVVLSLSWALLPIPLAAAVRRRARRKQRKSAEPRRDEEVVS